MAMKTRKISSSSHPYIPVRSFLRVPMVIEGICCCGCCHAGQRLHSCRWLWSFGNGEGGAVHWSHLHGQWCIIGYVMWCTCGPKCISNVVAKEKFLQPLPHQFPLLSFPIMPKYLYKGLSAYVPWES